MRYRKLGKCNLKVSELALGTMTFGGQTAEKDAFEIMDKAYDAGVNLLDCADIYPLGGGMEKAGSTETIVGRWLRNRHREEMIVVSKCYAKVQPHENGRGLGRAHILTAVENSLKRLQTDYIDLYLAHAFDEETDMDETLRAFEDIARQGKVRFVGVSNWAAWQMSKALGIAQGRQYLPIVADELRYNLLFRRSETEILPMCESEGLGVLAYNPLAGGLLTGRYKPREAPQSHSRFDISVGGPLYHQRYWRDACFQAVDHYLALCRQWNVSPVTTAVRWTLMRRAVSSVLVGASKKEQLDATLAACDASALNEEQVAALDALWYSLPRYKGENLH